MTSPVDRHVPRAPSPPAAVPRLVPLARHGDERGHLDVAELSTQLPFLPVRLFVVSGVPAGVTRGGHAQLTGHELLLCVSGSCTVDTDTGRERRTFVLDDPTLGLYLPPLVWVSYRHASPATALVVLASTCFDPTGTIDDRATFLSVVESKP